MFDEFTQESEEDILQNMQNDLGTSVDSSQGSFVYDALKPTARQIYNTRVDLDTVLMYAFAQTSGDKFLDLVGEGRGVPRVLGEKATGKVMFSGASGTFIPSNTLVQSSSDIRFFTIEDTTIPDGEVTIEVAIIAENIGSSYNLPANSIMQIPIAVPGITSVINLLQTQGGTDSENDDDYRSRILQRLVNPPSSGNKEDYERWAGEVSGVKGAKVIPLWNGPGTVKLIAYGVDGEPIDEVMLENLKNHIDPEAEGQGEGKAPIGAVVTVVTPTTKAVDVNISGLISSNIDAAKTNIENNLKELFLKINPGETLKLITAIAAVADADETVDFSSLTLNGQAENVSSTDEEKIVLRSVTYE